MNARIVVVEIIAALAGIALFIVVFRMIKRAIGPEFPAEKNS